MVKNLIRKLQVVTASFCKANETQQMHRSLQFKTVFNRHRFT